jgi:Pvc16 N-terminal domain
MISSVLTTITQLLNAYLNRKFQNRTNKVLLSGLVGPDGNTIIKDESALVLSIVNIEHETHRKTNAGYVHLNGGSIGQQYPPVNVNVYLLLSMLFNEKQYPEGLKWLSAAIGFFQSNPVFNHQNMSDLPSSIKKITCEIVNLSIQDMSHFWGALGAKYQPSIIYKLRMLSIQEGDIRAELPQTQQAPEVVT